MRQLFYLFNKKALSIGLVGVAGLTAIPWYNTRQLEKSILVKIPTNKATVGVIPCFINNSQLYLLLGRERIDSDKKEKAGKFSEKFGY